MHPSSLRAAALALAFTAGCATAGLPPPPPEIEMPAGWIEMRSEHFTLRTNLHHDAAFESLYRLERTRASLGLVLWGPKPPESPPLEVIQVRLRTEMGEFGLETSGTELTRTRLGPLLIISGEVNDQRDFEAAASLGGFLEHQHHHHQPYWLGMGMGNFVGTLRVAEGGDALQVGGAFLESRRRGGPTLGGFHGPADVNWLRLHGRLGAAELFAYSPARLNAEEDPHRFHATAWLLVAFLRQTRGEAFRAYQAKLDQGASFEAAWTSTFPDLDPTTLDHLLQVFLDEGVFVAQRFHVKPLFANAGPLPGFTQRALSPAEVHAVRAELFLTALGPRSHAEREALARREVGATPPSDASAIETALEWSRPAELRAAAERGAVASPQDPRAWRTLVATEVEPEQRPALTDALDHLIALQPTANEALAARAELLLNASQPADALPFAERAFALSEEPVTLGFVARAQAGVGRCDEASARIRRATAWLNPSDGKAMAWKLDAWSKLIAHQCQAGPVGEVPSPPAPPAPPATAPPAPQ